MKLRSLIYKYLPLVPAVLALGQIFLSSSCANTTTPPSGGDKDTIPPLIVDIRPLPGTVNVPVHNARIEFTFNEYIKVKDPKGIFLSPPLSKMPKFRIRGRSLVVYFEEDLDSNTTYTLDLTGAVTDNNEGNMFPGYTLAFSTGDRIDSMAVTGTVRDCNSLQPIKGATVLLYKDLADSAAFLHRPDAAVKTDDWGFFALRNVADTAYRLYAIIDESSNNIYDPDNDKLAFVDSVIRPTLRVGDDVPELLKYDMKDTLHCMARKSEYDMVVFREKPTKQMLVNRERPDARSAYITFMAPDAKIDSIWSPNISTNNLIFQFNQQRDSLEIWLNDRRRKQIDTLQLYVDYLKTDSTGTLVPFTEHLKLIAANSKGKSKSSRRDIKHQDTLCVMTISAEPERIEQYGFEFEFKYPIISEGFKETSLISVNPRQQEKKAEFEIIPDSTNLRKFTLMPKEQFQKGYDYILKVPHRKFRDINGFYNDSTEVKVALPKEDNLSAISMELSNVAYPYIVDLLNEKRDKTLRSYHISSDCTLNFPYLKKGKYSVRFTEDRNGNGLVDTGSLLQHRQPEQVKFFTLPGGSYVIDIMENTELVQSVDVAKLFEQ